MPVNLEKYLEDRFVAWCNERDIVAMKGPAGLSKGFPDRFASLPNGGGTIYVEFKGTSYYDLSQIQQWWQRYLLLSDPYRTFVVRSKEDLAQLFEKCETFIKIGPQIVEFERQLLEERAIIKENQEK